MDFQLSVTKTDASPRTLTFAGLILLLVSFIFLAVAAIIAFKVDHFVSAATQTTGVVIALAEKHDAKRDSITYAPVFTFATESGQTQSVTSSVATSPASYAVGDKVPVLYRPADPADAKIDSFWQLWFLPVLFAGFGSTELLTGIVLLYIAHRKVMRKAAHLQGGV